MRVGSAQAGNCCSVCTSDHALLEPISSVLTTDRRARAADKRREALDKSRRTADRAFARQLGHGAQAYCSGALPFDREMRRRLRQRSYPCAFRGMPLAVLGVAGVNRSGLNRRTARRPYDDECICILLASALLPGSGSVSAERLARRLRSTIFSDVSNRCIGGNAAEH